jgi:putative membrane protein
MLSPDEVRGVPRERTALAWERSALGFATLAAIVVGIAARRDAPGLLVLALALLAVAAGVGRHSRREYARSAVRPAPRAIALVTLATVVAALAAVAAVLARL